MRANCWMGMNQLQVREVPDPQLLSDRDAVVRVTSTAICGSDLHLYDGFVPEMKRGDVLGHEFMGEVVELGKGVRERGSDLRVGDRVVVPFPIACGACWQCSRGMTALCENSNPNAGLVEKIWGHSTSGIYGYSHLTGGYQGGQAEYVRVPFADANPMKVPDELDDEQVLFLTDILPTGYMGAEMADIEKGDVVAVWGCGPVGQFAITSARLLGAAVVIGIDPEPYRLAMARDKAGADHVLNSDEVDVMQALKELTAGRGPDRVIDAAGLEAHHGNPVIHAYDRVKQATMSETERPHALRQAVLSVRNGGVVSIVGVYGGFMDKFPIGSLMNRSITVRTGQTHVHRYLEPLLERIRKGELDPTFIITHRMRLEDAPRGYEIFKHKKDDCMKVVLSTGHRR
ncbi:MAG: glutathione-dependent formaldehyde dehydrogenase [Actinomycetota bacterium]|nr:glutathione-dependent formaldehyde dehydrogenase [Actinomycetota bacterium]